MFVLYQNLCTKVRSDWNRRGSDGSTPVKTEPRDTKGENKANSDLVLRESQGRFGFQTPTWSNCKWIKCKAIGTSWLVQTGLGTFLCISTNKRCLQFLQPGDSKVDASSAGERGVSGRDAGPPMHAADLCDGQEVGQLQHQKTSHLQ